MYRKLKALRQFKNLNQDKTAEILGISSHAYHNKENGKTSFTLEEAKVLSDLFGLTVDDIFFNESVPNMGTASTA